MRQHRIQLFPCHLRFLIDRESHVLAWWGTDERLVVPSEQWIGRVPLAAILPPSLRDLFEQGLEQVRCGRTVCFYYTRTKAAWGGARHFRALMAPWADRISITVFLCQETLTDHQCIILRQPHEE